MFIRLAVNKTSIAGYLSWELRVKSSKLSIRHRPPQPFRIGWQNGLALIEVIAGIALAGSLLVGILLSMSAHARQLRQLELGEAGLQKLDQLLSRWAQSDFRQERLLQAAKETDTLLDPSVPNQDRSSNLLWIRVSHRPLLEGPEWKLEKVKLEAVSFASGKAVALLEIVRYAP